MHSSINTCTLLAWSASLGRQFGNISVAMNDWSWPVFQLKGVQVILHQFSSISKVTVTEPFAMFGNTFQVRLAERVTKDHTVLLIPRCERGVGSDPPCSVKWGTQTFPPPTPPPHP